MEIAPCISSRLLAMPLKVALSVSAASWYGPLACKAWIAMELIYFSVQLCIKTYLELKVRVSFVSVNNL